MTWEVRDGILNHQTELMPSTLEGKIVRFSDKIAYINHDIDDAIRGQVLREEEIPREIRQILGGNTRIRLNTMIHDIVGNSIHKNQISMTNDVEQAMKDLRSFMFEHVYRNPAAKGEEKKAKSLLEFLYQYYYEHIDLLPQKYLNMLDLGERQDRIVCDYIAGMTDEFAYRQFEEYFLPKSWQIF